MAQNDRLAKLGPWKKGMNNVQPNYALDAESLRDAVNVDMFDDGRARRRKGYREVMAGVEMHSLHYHVMGDFFVVVDNGDLKRIVENAPGLLTVQAVLGSGFGDRYAPLYEAQINDTMFFSDAVRTGRVLADGTLRAWGVERPAFQPTLAAVGGTLPGGKYMVALTYEGYEDEEGGASTPKSITITDGQSIQLSAIPQPSHVDTTRIVVYVSEQNGEVLYRYGDYPVGTLLVTINAVNTQGRQLKTLHCYPPPAGKHVEYCMGRMFIAVGNIVYFSDPLWYGLFRLAKNFFMYTGEVKLLVAVDDGLYVVADRTYFVSNPGSGELTQAEVLGYSGASRTRVKYIEGERKKVAWFSDVGWVIASNGGTLEKVMEDEIALARHSEGAAMYREQDGIAQLIATVRGGSDRSALVARDFVDGESSRGA